MRSLTSPNCLLFQPEGHDGLSPKQAIQQMSAAWRLEFLRQWVIMFVFSLMAGTDLERGLAEMARTDSGALQQVQHYIFAHQLVLLSNMYRDNRIERFLTGSSSTPKLLEYHPFGQVGVSGQQTIRQISAVWSPDDLGWPGIGVETWCGELPPLCECLTTDVSSRVKRSYAGALQQVQH